MRETIKSHLKKNIPTYSNQQFMDWVQKQHGQIALTTVQIMFTYDVGCALDSKSSSGINLSTIGDNLRNNLDNSNSSGSNLSTIGDNLRNNLNKLSSVIKHDMTIDKRNVVVALIITVVHQRDILDDLIQTSVQSSSDFQWIR